MDISKFMALYKCSSSYYYYGIQQGINFYGQPLSFLYWYSQTKQNRRNRHLVMCRASCKTLFVINSYISHLCNSTYQNNPHLLHHWHQHPTHNQVNKILYTNSHENQTASAATYQWDTAGGACDRRARRRVLMSSRHRPWHSCRRHRHGETATAPRRHGAGPDARSASPDWRPGRAYWWAGGGQGRGGNCVAV